MGFIWLPANLIDLVHLMFCPPRCDDDDDDGGAGAPSLPSARVAYHFSPVSDPDPGLHITIAIIIIAAINLLAVPRWTHNLLESNVEPTHFLAALLDPAVGYCGLYWTLWLLPQCTAELCPPCWILLFFTFLDLISLLLRYNHAGHALETHPLWSCGVSDCNTWPLTAFTLWDDCDSGQPSSCVPSHKALCTVSYICVYVCVSSM